MTAINPTLTAPGDVSLARDAATQQTIQNLRRVDPAQADKAGREFEAMFLSSMLQPMFASVKSNGLFGGGHAEDSWRAFYVDELGKMIAKTGGVGIADKVRQEMLRTQEVK